MTDFSDPSVQALGPIVRRVVHVRRSARGANLYQIYWNEKESVQLWIKPDRELEDGAPCRVWVLAQSLSTEESKAEALTIKQQLEEAVKWDRELKAESRAFA